MEANLMRRKPEYLLIGIVAAIAGCTARAEEERQAAAAVPGELRVRIDKDAVQSFMAPERQVHVTGMAKVAVPPDMAEVWIGVNTARPTALEAVGANNAAMTDLIDAIKKRGVAPRDIRTSRVSISPQYSQQAVDARPGLPPVMTEPKVVGYEVSNTVQVTTRDLPKIGELLDAGVNAGSNQLQGIYFLIENREGVVATLRTKAFDDARAKAEVYAKQSGMTLGPVAQITEADPGWMPSPGGPGPMMMAAPAAPGPSMPVNPGEQEVSLSVAVSYELKSGK
jgi:uncharacterized protein